MIRTSKEKEQKSLLIYCIINHKMRLRFAFSLADKI